MSNARLIIIGLFSLLLLGCNGTSNLEITSSGEVHRLNVEIVEELDELTQGLMGRTELSEDGGMLFIYPSETRLFFWMKNMRMPLDMIFLDKEKVIIYIAKDVQICNQDLTPTCPSYGPKEKGQYVLEVEAGFTETKNIRVGDKIEFTR